MDPIQKIIDFATQRGVEVFRVSEDRYSEIRESSDFSEAPFVEHSLGIDWGAKKLFYAKDVPWPALIHELGHILASPHHPEDPTLIDEFDFLGWERGVVDYLGLNFEDYTKDNFYTIQWRIPGHYTWEAHDLQDLLFFRKDIQEVFWDEARALSRKKGLLDENNKPLVVR